jgi:DNA polymerase-3 subunit delta'
MSDAHDSTAGAAWPLVGHAAAVADFRAAFDSGRLHHAWLIDGPSGIGKAQLAKQIASFVLGAACAPDTLETSAADPIAQKLLAESHPDLRWLDRRPDEAGKFKQDIPVDAIRELNAFFALKPAMGGWRVGVIDSVDELNRSGTNALLKTLEEPPPQCLLILITHGTRPLLPTVRSRCRRLRLGTLSEPDVQLVLQSLPPEARPSNAEAALSLARGRPGYGMKLSSPSGLAAANAARNFLRGLPKPSDGVLGDAIAKIGADAIAFEVFSNMTLDWLSARAAEQPDIASTYLDVSRLIATSTELNMDRTQAGAELIGTLQKVSVRG